MTNTNRQSIKFLCPPTASLDSTNTKHFFNPLTDKKGVYIIGVKLENKFCPLYVGEAGRSIFERIKTHHWRYGGGNGGMNSEQELFNLKGAINKVYEDIEVWNTEWDSLNSNSKKNKKINLFNKIKNKNNTLIWFNCNTFFDHYLGLTSISKYEEEYRGHDSSIYYDLQEINKTYPKNGVQNLIDNIKETKEIIHNNFYYMYWEQENNLELKDVEAATKKALEKLNIFTHSHANKKIKNKYMIDLSCIGNDMISLPDVKLDSRLRIEV